MKHVFKLMHFLKPYWVKSTLALVLLVIVVVLDLAIPRLVQRIIDQGILAGDMQEVWQTFLLMLVISVVNTLFAIGNNNLSVQVGEGVARDLREALFLKIQSFSFGNLDRMKTGQLMVRLSSDSSVVQRLVQITLRIGTRAPLIMIGSIILMFNTDRRLAMMLVPLLLITSAIIVFFVIKMGPLFLTMQQKLDRLNTVLQENIAGVRVVKAFVRAEHEAERFEDANEDYTERNIRVMEFMSTHGPGPERLCQHRHRGGDLGGRRADHPRRRDHRADRSLRQLPADRPGADADHGQPGQRLGGRHRLGGARQRGAGDRPRGAGCTGRGCAARRLPGRRVVFENVGFHYNGSTDTTVLEGVNLTAEPGQTVAILGATGAGKSTLVNLIPRFYDVTQGRILIDGEDIRQVSAEIRCWTRIGIVPQETVLFSGTVRDNIRYGRPHATDEEVVAAAKMAQAHDFILELPDGYDTRIEERGVNLSGGQKQRIAIARALLTHPDILILDDSTSSVDVETETKIQNALEDVDERPHQFRGGAAHQHGAQSR